MLPDACPGNELYSALMLYEATLARWLQSAAVSGGTMRAMPAAVPLPSDAAPHAWRMRAPAASRQGQQLCLLRRVGVAHVLGGVRAELGRRGGASRAVLAVRAGGCRWDRARAGWDERTPGSEVEPPPW